MNICVIPARGGSRRIPYKNVRMFAGKSIIAYSIETARASRLFDAIYVSTDDDWIATVSRAHGAEVIQRPMELARDEIGTQTVMCHAVETISYGRPRDIGIACCLYATAPLVTPQDLLIAHQLQVLRPCRYVISVAVDPLRDIGNFYIGDGIYFAEGIPLWGTHTGLYVMPADRAIDINTESDWDKAEEIYAKLHK